MIRKLCLALAASLGLTGTAHASYDTFLRIDSIEGTSTAHGLESYIEIYSFSLGFTRGTCSSLSVMKSMDESSAPLTEAVLMGTLFPTATVVMRRPGERPFTFLRLTLSNVVVTSLQESGSAGGDFRPTESLSIQPSSVKMEAFEENEFGIVVPTASKTVTCQKVK